MKALCVSDSRFVFRLFFHLPLYLAQSLSRLRWLVAQLLRALDFLETWLTIARENQSDIVWSSRATVAKFPGNLIRSTIDPLLEPDSFFNKRMIYETF